MISCNIQYRPIHLGDDGPLLGSWFLDSFTCSAHKKTKWGKNKTFQSSLEIIISHTRMNAHSELELLVRAMSYWECFDGFQHLQRHPGDLPWVLISVAYWQPWGNHVGITNSFHLFKFQKKLKINFHLAIHLVDIVVFYDGVKAGVQFIEELDNLKDCYWEQWGLRA